MRGDANANYQNGCTMVVSILYLLDFSKNNNVRKGFVIESVRYIEKDTM